MLFIFILLHNKFEKNVFFYNFVDFESIYYYIEE